jgi:hypothetical protein
MDSVAKEACEKEHRRVDENMNRTEDRLNKHSDRLDSVEDAVLKLTVLVDAIGKKSIFDKVLTVSVFIIAVVLLAVILGPEYVGKLIGGM